MSRVPITSFRMASRIALTIAALLSSPAHSAETVRDDTGRDVRVERPARRIVSLAPHITELLYEIGAGDRLVATTAYSDYPGGAERVPRIGGLAGVDLERIIALKPDLVIGWSSGTSTVEFDRLERVGVPVFRSEPHALDDVATTLERFGRLTGEDAKARDAATRFRAKVASLRATYANRTPVRVFFQVWNNPLMTVGGPQLITQVIELCGGRNVFASLTTLAPTVDAEAVIKADPQVIATAATRTDHEDDISAWRRWRDVAAVRDRRYVFLDPGEITRHTSRVLIGAEQLCRAIDAARTR